MADEPTLHSTDGVRQYTRGLGRRASKTTSAARRKKAPFRRTFDSASAAADRFYAENIDFLQPILDHGEPREAVREWLRSNAHGRTGRMRVKDLSQTPWAAKMLTSADPVKGALRNVFGHAEGRRWDRVDWDAIRALGETLAEFASESEGAGPGGWTWFPIAVEDDDAKILDRLSVEGEPDAYRQFAASLSSREVDAVVATYEQEVERLARCMPTPRRRHVEARLAEIRRWKAEGIPESVCGQGVYAGHTCDLEPLHGELKRLRDACESDAAYSAWRNEAVRRSPREGSAAEGDGDDVPLDFVPVAAFDGDEPVAAEPCTPSEAARVMGRLAAAKRRENAARRKKIREANAAERAAERKRVSQARKDQREASRRRSGGKGRRVASAQPKPKSKPPSPAPLSHEERLAIGGTSRDKALLEKYGKGRVGKLIVRFIDGAVSDEELRELQALGLVQEDVITDDGWVLYQGIRRGRLSSSESSPLKDGALPGLRWEFSKSRDAWRLLNVHGYQVAAMNHGVSGIWIAFVHPPGKKAPRVHIDDEAKPPVAKRKVEHAVLDAMAGEWWTDLRGDQMFPPAPAPARERATVAVLEVFDAAVMQQVKPKHVAKAIKLLVDREGLLPPGYTLSARTPREGVVYLSVRARGKKDPEAVTARMQALFPEFHDGLGQSELWLVPSSWDGARRLKTIRSKYADTLRVLAQREAGVQTDEATALDEPAVAVNYGPVRVAEPKKCDGQWCAEVSGEARAGDPIRVVTRRGKQWDAVVTEVVRTYTKKARGLKAGGLRSIVRSRKLPPAVLRGRPKPRAATEPKAGSTTAVSKRAGADLRFFGRDADSRDRRMKHEEGLAVLEGKPAPLWAVYVFAYPKERKSQYVRGASGEPRAVVYGPSGLEVHLKEALRRLRRDRDAGELAKDTEAMLEVLGTFHDGLSARSGPSKTVAKPATRPATKPATKQGSLVTPEQEGFALTHPRGTAAAHGASAGTGGTQSVLPGVSRKVSATKLSEMKERERARRAATPSSDISRITAATLQAELFELEGQLGTGSWSKARADAHHASVGAVMDELFARGVLQPVLSDTDNADTNDRPLQAMSEDAVDNVFRGKDSRFAAPRWLATNVAYALEESFAGGGLTLVRGPRSKTSGRAESLYVLRKGALLAYRGRRARVTVRQHGGYYTVEVDGMPKGVVDLVESAARTVMADPKLGMRDQGGGLSWRHA